MIKMYKIDENNQLIEDNKIEKDIWINLVNPTLDEIEKIAHEVNISKNIITQVLVEKELPRIKKSDNVTLFVINIPFMKDKNIKNKYVTYPLGIIICDLCIITVSLVEHEFLKAFFAGKVENLNPAKKLRLLIQILLKSTEAYLYTLDAIELDIEKMEKSTYKSTNNRQLVNFLNIQKTLVYFITSLHANNGVLEKLQKENILIVDKDNKSLLEDAIIENKQCIETCTVYREILSSTIDTYGTIISNNLNVIMKFLAGITIVFSVPTMIASFLGMNVPLGEIGENGMSFFFICLISFIISFIIACWLKKKNML